MEDIPPSATRCPVPPLAQSAADGPETTAPLRAGWLRLLAWLPIPVFLVAIGALWAANLPGSYESEYLLMALNLVFSTLVSGFIAYLVGRAASDLTPPRAASTQATAEINVHRCDLPILVSLLFAVPRWPLYTRLSLPASRASGR